MKDVRDAAIAALKSLMPIIHAAMDSNAWDVVQALSEAAERISKAMELIDQEWICSECVDICANIIQEKDRQLAEQWVASDTQTAAPEGGISPSPPAG